jgi:glycosyltransferase
MRVSIITATFNNHTTIRDCLKSIYSQTYSDIEHIIIDGESTDSTLDILKEYENRISILISEPDDGIYNALNKGIKIATGTIVGFLHADDYFAHNKAIENIVSQISKHTVDGCYSDLVYVSRNDPKKVIRYWRSSPYSEDLMRKGWMPPHPTLFVKKSVYENLGCFNTDFKISADYELILRLFEKNRISTHYIPEVLVKMKIGGASNKNLINMVRKTYEDYRAWKVNNLDFRIYTIFLKNIIKIPQFFKRF